MSVTPHPLPGAGGPHAVVVYAGVHGSTRSIATHLAARLADRGIRTEALPAEAVGDPSAYDVFVIGSAVHDMAWLPQALAFVRTNAALLAGRDVWLFSVGMPAALRGPWKALVAREESHVIGGLAGQLRPRGHRMFSGVIEPEHLTRAGRVKFQAMGLRYGDYRDWPAIGAWAEEIGHAIDRRRYGKAGGSPS
ncbi:flavodoxin domain-containing protein [Streptomyces heilongjiangensis]|uniref:Flavodoxin domain-containing protein n=1 Tax=Streptomyces heilongjiangensis TaxID=945052 RepID=A0ABW1B7P8_9ACTN|nr:flavodoxin domain-containing protein [Streptomyces heilongjiangensis]MDC2947360.1 flavodoxin domain-containing protein [Streptomyces heilongjiangensis]